MRFSRALSNRYANEYDILNLPPEQFREYLDNLQRKYDERMRLMQEEQDYAAQVGSEIEDEFQEMAPSERQELIDEGYLEAQQGPKVILVEVSEGGYEVMLDDGRDWSPLLEEFKAGDTQGRGIEQFLRENGATFLPREKIYMYDYQRV